MSNIEKLSGEDLLKKLIAAMNSELKNEDGKILLSREDFGYGDIDTETWGEYKQVDTGGGEDEGSGAYSVIHFEVHDVYVRMNGYYASHYGYDWDNDPYLVTPKEKTITVYE